MQPASSSLRRKPSSLLARLHKGRTPILGWLLCWAAILVAGLWPFEFHPRNAVEWLQSENGIRFDGVGMAYSTSSLAELVASSRPGQPSFTLELLARPRRQDLSRVDRIFSEDGPDGRPGLVIAQYRPDLVVRTYFRGPDHAVFREMNVGGVLVAGRATHIAVTSGARGTELYVNGLRARASVYPIAANLLVGPWVLGNSGQTDRAWSGDLLGLALYDGQRNGDQILRDAGAWMSRRPDSREAVAFYEFAEKSGELAESKGSHGVPLQVPRSLVILNRRILSWDLQLKKSGLRDVVENVAGFVPFGFFAAAVLAGRRSWRASTLSAILAGFALSLFVETVQSYLPMRDSSSTDLLANTVGTAAGAVLLAITWRAST